MPLTKQTKVVVIISLILVTVSVITFFTFEKTQQEAELPTMTVEEKKARFNELLVPAVDHVYADLMQQYLEIKQKIDAEEDSGKIEKLKTQYKVTTNNELLMALKPHPKSIALAQAAMESSWATSRFSREANNLFGVWSFDEDEPRIAALQKRGDQTIWVKKYSSIRQAVYDYYRVLAQGDAFTEFRQAKMTTDDPFVLVTKLDRYSEKGSLYGEELAVIIKSNSFDDHDKS